MEFCKKRNKEAYEVFARPYDEIGARAKKLFYKGYPTGFYSLDAKGTTNTGVNLCCNGLMNHETGSVNGDLETNYTIPSKEISFIEKWSTDNILSSEIGLNNLFETGFTLGALFGFAPHTGKKSTIVKTAYKHESILANFDVDLSEDSPVFKLSGVFAFKGWLAGCLLSMEPATQKLIKNNFCLGFEAKDFVVVTNVDNGHIYGGYIYHKINKNFQAGVSCGWSSTSHDTKLGVALKYKLHENVAVKGKLNNLMQLCLAYHQRVHESVKVMMSTQIDCNNFNGGTHKVGLGFEITV